MITFALILGLAVIGVLPPWASGPAFSRGLGQAAPRALQANVTATSVTGVQLTVGAIPGLVPGSAPASLAIAAKPLPSSDADGSSRLRKLRQADVLLIAKGPLPIGLLAKLRQLAGVQAAVPVDAGRIQVDGSFVNVLGVSPSRFRPFAAGPTARSAVLWQNVAAGGMAISYTMGKLDRLTLAKPVTVVGARKMTLPVAGFGTVGIAGVDAVVSRRVALSLGLPRSNAVVISAPRARLDLLTARIRKLAPKGTAVAALVTQVISSGSVVSSGAAGAFDITAAQGAGLTTAQLVRFLIAAESRLGMPYVWGGAGPGIFDCSGLVQWSMRQAGVIMPRVAADQARTGPLVPLADLRPGDLLFYHTDPTAPAYISHVAIYLGRGWMIQAPAPGQSVQIVRADFGAGFAGAVRVYPRLAAAVAGNPAG